MVTAGGVINQRGIITSNVRQVAEHCFRFFLIFNGVRQGSLLSPYLFRFHIRNLIDRITKPIVLAVTIFWHKINLNEFISLTKTHNQSSRNAEARQRRALTGVLSRLLAHADNIVLFTPSWCGMQSYLMLLRVLQMNLICCLIPTKLFVWWPGHHNSTSGFGFRDFAHPGRSTSTCIPNFGEISQSTAET